MSFGNFDLTLGVSWYAAFLFSVVLHEAAHAWSAWKLGDPTAYRGGQATLDPIPHLRRAPVGMILVPVLSFALMGWVIGWGCAPYNALWAQRFPKRAALMALAGPLANLFLVLIAALLIRLGMSLGYFHAPESCGFSVVTEAPSGGIAHGLAVLLSILFSLNLLLVAFNLLPLPPLDGAAVVSLFLTDGAARTYLNVMRQPTFALVGILVAWKFLPSVFGATFRVAFEVLYP